MKKKRNLKFYMLLLLIALTTSACKAQENKEEENHMYTNELINQTSPYLLQHAHNPVNWFPWGDEAQSKARTENKLMIISIGYSACHWCHAPYGTSH